MSELVTLLDRRLQMDWAYWEQIAKVAPLGTFLIAIVAAAIAIASWITQIRLATMTNLWVSFHED